VSEERPDGPMPERPEERRDAADGRPTVPPAAPVREEPPVLPDRSPDDSDEGWGERGGGGRDDDWYERERPPHW
jgi:hypothetical protein